MLYRGRKDHTPIGGSFFFSRDFPTSPHPALPPYVVSDLTLRDLFFYVEGDAAPWAGGHIVGGGVEDSVSRRSAWIFFFFAADAAIPRRGVP